MDNEVNEKNEQLQEGYTEFPGPKIWDADTGLSGKFFAFFRKRFGFNRRGRPSKQPSPTQGDAQSPLEGDGWGAGGVGVSRTMYRLPSVENSRKRRYNEFDKMDEYPELGAAFDVYADDGTLEDIQNKVFEVKTEDQLLKEEIDTFYRRINFKHFIWDIFRNVVKFGDCFIENIVDLNNPDAGIQRIKILNPNYIYRIEDQYGYLLNFIQEIPKGSGEGFENTPVINKDNSLVLDKNQLVHFRRRTSDANFYPYGKSVASAGIRAWRNLKMMEDAMIIYRLQRAPERRVFYIETGNLPSSKIEAFVDRLKQKFKKQKFYNPNVGGPDNRYNPLSFDEDFFIPVKNGQGTKLDVLPGGQNLGEVDDVKYFRDKLLAAMRIPKDFIVEKDKSPDRKANLSQLDVQFAKAVHRVQKDVELGILELTRRHLLLKGWGSVSVKDLEILLTAPSDMHEKRRMELDEQKIRIVAGVKGLMMFDDDYIYKTYFNLSDSEIAEMKKKVEEDMQKQQQMGMMPAGPGMGGGMAGPGMGAPPMGGAPMAQPQGEMGMGGTQVTPPPTPQ